MTEPQSALAAVYAAGPVGDGADPAPVTVRERCDRGLLQVAGWPADFADLHRHVARILDLPAPTCGTRAVAGGARVLFRVGPDRLWVAGPAGDDSGARVAAGLAVRDAAFVDLGHSRTVLRVAGPASAVLLNRGLPIDLDDGVFPVDAFAQSLVHHTPVLVHRVGAGGDAAFDVYVPREYAVSFWEWLLGATAPLGGRVLEPA